MLLLLLIVLGVYYPAIFGAINSIDDVHILKTFGINGTLSLADIFRPGRGYYYRPLVDLSYYLDYRFWDQDKVIMHLENILIHGANVTLVFLIATRFMGTSFFPFLSGLLFAVHPVNSEAVCWIAGRTDPLSATFLLMATFFLVYAVETGKGRYIIVSLPLIVLATLAKETAFLFLPVPLIVSLWLLRKNETEKKPEMVIVSCACAALIFLPFIYLFFRTGTHADSIAAILKGNSRNPLDTILFSLSIFGFYVKKILFPFPLNFAITTVSTLYSIVGVSAVLLLFCVPRRTPYFILLVTAFMFILPAVAVAVYNVSWTVAAERYLYIPTAFFTLSMTGYLHDVTENTGKRFWPNTIILSCCILSAIFVFQRSLLWQSNLELYRDTVNKSPDFAMIRNEFAVALLQEGRVAEGSAELKKAKAQTTSEEIRKIIAMNELLVMIDGKSLEETRAIIRASLGGDNVKGSTELLSMLRNYDYLLLDDATSEARKKELIAELIEITDILYSRTKDPLLLYNNGQLYLKMGDEKQAFDCFSLSYETAPEGAHFKAAARRLAEKLGKQDR